MNYSFTISEIQDDTLDLDTQIYRAETVLVEAKKGSGWANMLFREALSHILQNLRSQRI